MSHKQRIVAIRFIVGVTMIGSLLLAGGSLPPRSSAQGSRKSNATRWEYCAILYAQRKFPQANKEKFVATATICYFRTSGCRKEEVTYELTYSDYLKEGEPIVKQGESYNRSYGAFHTAVESALSKAIAKLGNDGWEMIGDNRFDFSNAADANNSALYFKRRVSR